MLQINKQRNIHCHAQCNSLGVSGQHLYLYWNLKLMFWSTAWPKIDCLGHRMCYWMWFLRIIFWSSCLSYFADFCYEYSSDFRLPFIICCMLVWFQFEEGKSIGVEHRLSEEGCFKCISFMVLHFSVCHSQLLWLDLPSQVYL